LGSGKEGNGTGFNERESGELGFLELQCGIGEMLEREDSKHRFHFQKG